VPIVVLNQDCTIRASNTAFGDLTQMQARELENRSMPDLVNHLWGVGSLRDKLDQLIQSPPGASLEFEHQSPTAQKKSLYIRAKALATDGDRVLLLMIEDITLRRETEMLVAREKEALEGAIEIAARKLNRTQEELRGLTAHLFTVQEEERQRVARELHDDICQRLSAVEIQLHELMKDPDHKLDQQSLESARGQVYSLNNDVRQISHRLHPAILQDLGLPAALRAMVKEFGERENMPATYTGQDVPEVLPHETSTALYRIAQEALRNVSKHAGKTHVKIVLNGADSRLVLRVMDFGLGFDHETDGHSGGLGMISMQERARLAGGTLKVESYLGHGTTVTATVPVERNA
jgi:signal transduction histidine kinase